MPVKALTVWETSDKKRFDSSEEAYMHEARTKILDAGFSQEDFERIRDNAATLVTVIWNLTSATFRDNFDIE